ncbi:hypothetical protein HMPREF9374_3192 [Desmospora sp. 8437]|nr:hypothetical protein HMPREF9374_3192 [Desmospora sp. 8437]
MVREVAVNRVNNATPSHREKGGARPETRTAGKLPILRWEGKAVHYFLL